MAKIGRDTAFDIWSNSKGELCATESHQDFVELCDAPPRFDIHKGRTLAKGKKQAVDRYVASLKII